MSKRFQDFKADNNKTTSATTTNEDGTHKINVYTFAWSSSEEKTDTTQPATEEDGHNQEAEASTSATTLKPHVLFSASSSVIYH